MAIYLDSASISDIKQAMDLGFISGVTTNPLLMAKEGGPCRERLKDICDIVDGPVYYQIDTKTKSKFEQMAREICEISKGQIILKIPASPDYYKVLPEISSEIPCCVTAVYSVPQMIAANEAGAKQVAVYVNRISRFHKEGRDGASCSGPELIAHMRDVIDYHAMDIEILAASLKSTEELTEAISAGAHHITTTLDILQQMTTNPLSEEALAEFNNVLQ